MSAKKRIAIVDDAETFCTLVRLNLESTGRFEVLAVNDPREAEAALAQFKPDLALVDMMMPEMTGAELAARLRALPATAAIPVIFLTASVDSSCSEAPVAGCGVLSKPVTTSELVRRIDAALRPPL